MVSATPSRGSRSHQSFTFSAAAPGGAAGVKAFDAIINSTLSDVDSCVVAYDHASNTLMLANDAGTGWSPRLAVGGAGTISNSQCAIEGSGSSLSESESGLGVTVPLTFDVSFGGPKSIYAMAVDSAGGTSGWQSVGTWSVRPRAPSISLDARNPGSGLATTFSLTTATSEGGAAVGWIGLKIQSVTGSDSCLVAYDPASNTLQLSEDNSGARWSAPLPLDGVGTICESAVRDPRKR